ncbi:hypothetical protein [uncultured Thiodictyon sp.]|uniref:hypothetical protein n=1 Tax=uncultured Thiodictyon sp. TaxID=1846217 RepID=UPI0025E73DBD|nr:hypothetical protein [uncultured Thiodictyon sp.]
MNMSYCRFQNTLSALTDCAEHIRDLDPSDAHSNTGEERRARAQLLRTAADLLTELEIDDPSDPRQVEDAITELDAYGPDTEAAG